MKLIGNGGIRQLTAHKYELWQFVEVDGKRRQRTRTITGGKKDAYAALRDFQNDLADQLPPSDSFAAYAASWLSWRADSGHYATSTVKNCASMVRAFAPHLQMPMSEITSQDCRAALSTVKAQRNLTGTSARTKYAMLHALFAQAVKDGVIASNPLDAVEPPSIDTQERDALSPAEIDALWQRVSALPLSSYTMAVFLALDAGLRIGECVWLKAEDVDDKRLVVSRSKTDAGLRTLPLTSRLHDKCAEWQATRADRGIADAITFCCRVDGLPLARETLRNWYKKHRAALQAPPRFHDLRHSNLSKMARYMGAHDLQRWAGWTSIAMASRYVHDDYDQLELAVSRMENVG